MRHYETRTKIMMGLPTMSILFKIEFVACAHVRGVCEVIHVSGWYTWTRITSGMAMSEKNQRDLREMLRKCPNARGMSQLEPISRTITPIQKYNDNNERDVNTAK